MVKPKYAASADLNQQEILNDLRKAGFTVMVIGTPVDILCGHRARNFLFEIKRPGQKPRTPTQIEFLKTWPGQVRVIETAEDAIQVMERAYR